MFASVHSMCCAVGLVLVLTVALVVLLAGGGGPLTAEAAGPAEAAITGTSHTLDGGSDLLLLGVAFLTLGLSVVAGLKKKREMMRGFGR